MIHVSSLEGTIILTDASPAASAEENAGKETGYRVLSPRILTAAIVLFAAISISHSWNAWSRASISTAPSLRGDPREYVELMRTGDPTAVASPFRYRVFTPWLARFVPSPPAWLLAEPSLNSGQP